MISTTTFLGRTLLLGLAVTGCSRAEAHTTRTRQLYEQHCGRCHDIGAANAPKLGDERAWAMRLQKGRERLMRSMKEGVVAMPSGGRCVECTDEDLWAIVEYMSH